MEQRGAGRRVRAEELLGHLDSSVDLPGHHPLVPDAAERLALDELAHEPVAEQARSDFLERLTAPDDQFAQLAVPHPRERGTARPQAVARYPTKNFSSTENSGSVQATWP
ncbi:hypothetical protein [Streptomyces sp. NPDC058812]|uniref:hypothetical protein n=1 Tax=unclassified Streptomyces TaxID=2593676 RepID=UPI0036963542